MSFRIRAVEHRKCAAGLDCLTHTPVSSEVSDFTPRAHAQRDILAYIHHAEKN